MLRECGLVAAASRPSHSLSPSCPPRWRSRSPRATDNRWRTRRGRWVRSPDPSFGGGRGWVTDYGLRGLETVAYAATIAPAGRIVIAGQATDTHGHGQIVVARYLPNGHLDRAFASRGIFKTSLRTATGPYIGLAVRPQGRKLIVGGGYGLGSDHHLESS